MKRTVLFVVFFAVVVGSALGVNYTKFNFVRLVNSVIDNTVIGSSIPAAGTFTTANATTSMTAPSFTGALVGNASTATALATAGTPCAAGGGLTARGVDASGNANCTGPQVQRAATTSTCLTGAASYSSCRTTLTWPVTFTDNVYVFACSGLDVSVPADGASTGEAPTVTVVGHTSSTITVSTQTQRGQTAQYNEIDCIAVR